MPSITANLLEAATGCGRTLAATWAKPLDEACRLFEITTAQRVAAYLAQIGHESQGLTRAVENLNYSSPERIVRIFRRFDLDQDRVVDPEELALAKTYIGQPVSLANFVYGGRIGNSEPGDGWKYRGRGPGGLTGKANYEAMRDKLREVMSGVPDFVAEPGAVAEPKWGALAFAAYWDDRHLNDLADAGRFDDITRRINPGMAGKADRRNRYDRARKALIGA